MRETVQQRQRFTEEEVHQVLRRAAELQRRSPALPADVSALSLAELEQIATDSGIGVEQIHRAIVELDAQRSKRGSLFLGAPPHVHLGRFIDREIPNQEFERLVPEIARSLAQTGQVTVLGSTLTWSAPNTSSGPVEVTVSHVEAGTRISLDARFGGLVGATYGGIGGGLGTGLGAPLAGAIGQLSHSGAVAAGVFAGALGCALLAARLVYSAIVRRRVRALEQLVDRLQSQLIGPR